MLTIVIIICILLIGIVALLGWLIATIASNMSNQRSQLAAQANSVEMLAKQLEQIKDNEEKLRQSTEKTLSSNNSSITKTLETNQKLIKDITSELSNVQNTNKKIVDMSSDMRRLQDILQSPKLRGQLGEWSLENLLTQILPQGSFELQKKLSDGQIVDALVSLNKYSVAIDAKFPLPNFEKVILAQDQQQRLKHHKALTRDVKKHIDKIAKDYIRPNIGTLDFAIMYIPAENIYYETIIASMENDSNILEYAMEKKVIPVSPNLLYAYLMTIVMGLHGLEIQEQAAQIRTNLGKLKNLFGDFKKEWVVLGSHVNNVYKKYDDSSKRLDKFDLNLQQIQANEEENTD